MLNGILSLLVSCALVMGSGAVPAIPETAERITIDNIIVSCGDESIGLDYGIEYTEAIGSGESAVEFILTKNGESALPVKAKITPEELIFTLSENGGAYSVSSDFAAEYLGVYEGDIEILSTAAQIIEPIPEILPANSHMDFAEELYSVIEAQAAAEKMVGTIDFSGESVSCEEIVLSVGNGADFAFADAMRESETEHLSAFMQLLLDLINIAEESKYASFAEMDDSATDSDEYTMLKGETGAGETIYLLFVNSNNDEAGMSVYFSFTPHALSAKMDLAGEDEAENRIEYSCELENGEIVAANLAYDYECRSDEDDTYENSVSVTYDYSVANGLAERNFAYESRNYYSYRFSDGYSYSYSDDVRIAGSANDRADENGGIITGVDADIRSEYNYDGSDPTKLAAKLAFDVRSEDIPYQDSFAGAKAIPIESEDNIPPQLVGDAMVFSSRLALLRYDEKISALTEMLENAAEEAAGIEEGQDPAAGIDEGKLKKKNNKPSKPDTLVMPDKTEEPSSAIGEGKLKKKENKPSRPEIVLPDKTEAPSPVVGESALQAEYDMDSDAGETEAGKGIAFPDFTPPEAYVLDGAEEGEYDFCKTYYDADGNLLDFSALSVSYGGAYGHMQIELPEGESGMPVKLYYNDEGLVSGATFIKEGFYINIYSGKGVSLEEMEEMINSVTF